jgi:hypothetical protein
MTPVAKRAFMIFSSIVGVGRLYETQRNNISSDTGSGVFQGWLEVRRSAKGADPN